MASSNRSASTCGGRSPRPAAEVTPVRQPVRSTASLSMSISGTVPHRVRTWFLSRRRLRGSGAASKSAAIAEVEAFCADTGYPQTRFDVGTLAAAELLRRVGHGDVAEMGALLARAVPPLAPAVMLVPGPELMGRVVSSRWPTGGPPSKLLGPGRRPGPGSASGP